METGTTQKRAAQMVATSKQSRSATSGNKNVQTSARRKSASDQKSKVDGVFARTHTGPYLGGRSV